MGPNATNKVRSSFLKHAKSFSPENILGVLTFGVFATGAYQLHPINRIQNQSAKNNFAAGEKTYNPSMIYPK